MEPGICRPPNTYGDPPRKNALGSIAEGDAGCWIRASFDQYRLSEIPGPARAAPEIAKSGSNSEAMSKCFLVIIQVLSVHGAICWRLIETSKRIELWLRLHAAVIIELDRRREAPSARAIVARNASSEQREGRHGLEHALNQNAQIIPATLRA